MMNVGAADAAIKAPWINASTQLWDWEVKEKDRKHLHQS